MGKSLKFKKSFGMPGSIKFMLVFNHQSIEIKQTGYYSVGMPQAFTEHQRGPLNFTFPMKNQRNTF